MDACVVEVLTDGETEGRGDFRFLSLPGRGDRIVVPAPSSDLDIMEVLYVEHSPIEVQRQYDFERDTPTATIYVKFTGRFSG